MSSTETVQPIVRDDVAFRAVAKLRQILANAVAEEVAN